MEVSIIVTNYNYGAYIERCIRSCKNQVFEGKYEIIVVDDCSTDHSLKILELFKNDPQVNVILNKKNIGVAGSANIGIKNAKGQFVVRVDSDDYISRYFVLFLSQYLRVNPDIFCSSCDYFYVNNEGEKYERMYAEYSPVSCGIIYRKDLLNQFGLYNSEWRHREEEELRKRIGKQYRIGHLRIPLYRYRKHGENKTEQHDMMEEFKRKLRKISPPQVSNNVKELKDQYIVAVIPARLGSKRLKKKNILDIMGKPMIQYAIEAAFSSEYITDVFVSTESDEVALIAEKLGVNIIRRPENLAADNIIKQDVIVHSVKEIEKIKQPSIVVSLQANSPQVTGEIIDNCIYQLHSTNTNEVMTVDKNMVQNAAIRVMCYEAVFQKALSTYFSVYVKDLIDIHTKDDLQLVIDNM
jgi:glycosyltransferase involved in cell wall biosynthesis